jgi:hypothetical protein
MVITTHQRCLVIPTKSQKKVPPFLDNPSEGAHQGDTGDQHVEVERLQDLHVDTRAAIHVLAAPLQPIDSRVVVIREILEIHLLVAFLTRWIPHMEHGSIEIQTCHDDLPPIIYFPDYISLMRSTTPEISNSRKDAISVPAFSLKNLTAPASIVEEPLPRKFGPNALQISLSSHLYDEFTGE